MAIRQTRMFVHHMDTPDWAETIIGRVVRPLVTEFPEPLRWFWFSRYICLIGMPGEDLGDCDFGGIPNDYKQAFSGSNQSGHRSLRFRFEVEDARQEAFEERLQQLIGQYGYAISDVREYDQVGDTGGNRFLGLENRQGDRDVQRAQLVTQLFQAISQLVMDALVGPDAENRFRTEHNDLEQENPNGSTFESLHHLFYNITQVPLSVLFSAGGQSQLLGTFWGAPFRNRHISRNGQLITEVYVPF